MRNGRKSLHVLLMSTLAITIVGGGAMWSQEAKAQLVSPCLVFGSPLPPPCITFDFKKLAEMAKEQAQQVQRLQEMVNTVKETKASAESIGGALDSVKSLVNAGVNIAPGGGETFSDMASSSFSSTVSQFSKKLYDEPGVGLDAMEATAAARNDEAASANVDSLAMALQAKQYVAGSHKRMVCLSRAAQSSQDLRGDWAINSQTRLELLRQQAQRDHLLSVYLQNRAVQSAMSSPIEQGESVSYGSANPAPPVAARSPAWEMQNRLTDIETLIRTTLAAYSMATGIQNVREDAKAVQDRYQNAETAREQALNAFRQRAYSWDARHASYIVDTTISELNRIDGQMTALRERPISQLSGAFRDRNIDAAAMMENDVDPRQFIGTWGDPLKKKITDDMANALLDGRLDNYIDGKSDNQEYRDLLYAYNDARLEEAWMRNYASEASDVADQINALASDESQDLGYDLTPDAVKKRLEELVAEANSLGQQIQQTGDEVPTSQAARTLKAINDLLNGQPTEVTPEPVPSVTPTPTPSPTLPDPSDPDFDPSGPDGIPKQ